RDRNVTGVQTCALPISITSQANGNEGRLAADAVARAAAEKISLSPWKRARDCRMFLAANTSTRKVTAATIGTVSAARASISNAKSAPATNGYDTAGCASALPNARPVVSPAVTSAIETANRRVRVRTSTAPTAAGSTIIAN